MRRFGANITKLQAELRDLGYAVKATGEEIIDLDSDYAHLHSELNGQLSAASQVHLPPKNAV